MARMNYPARCIIASLAADDLREATLKAGAMAAFSRVAKDKSECEREVNSRGGATG